jgi:hypothetical protein
LKNSAIEGIVFIQRSFYAKPIAAILIGRLRVGGVQLAAAGWPGMLWLTAQHELSGLIEQSRVEVVHPQIRIDTLFGEEAELAVHQASQPVDALDAIVAILAAKKYGTACLVDLRTGRNQDLDHPLASNLLLVRKQQVRRVEFLRVIRQVGDVGLDLLKGIGFDTGVRVRRILRPRLSQESP